MTRAICSLLGVLLLTGCGLGLNVGPQPTAEAPVVRQEDEDIVVAEGLVEPVQWSALGFKTAGEVTEVLVEEGDPVAPAEVLVRLDQTDRLLAIRQAEAELEVAEAQLVLLQAGSKAEEVAAAEARLAAAEAAVERAAAERDRLLSGATEGEIAAALAAVIAAEAQQKVAQDRFDADTEDEDIVRSELHAATQALAAAEAKLAELRAGADANEIDGARAGVEAATAERDAAQAELELVEAGPTDEEVAIAEVAIARGRVALETARAALADAEVRAPFAGTVTSLQAEVGNAVRPGQVACTLATVDRLRVRTRDLSELDVVGIEAGQVVKVTVDALPNQAFEGVVRKVALQAEDFRGEAVYDVTVDLGDVGDTGLRWGMTAWVEFEGS